MTLRSFATQTSVGQPAQLQPIPPPASPAALQATPAIAQGPAFTGVMTREGVDALKARRSELSRQISSATDRRRDAVRELRSSPAGTARMGIEGRIAVLDQRLVQLETDIALNGQALAAAPGALLTSETIAPAQLYGPFSAGQLTGISIVSIVLIGAPLAFAAARVMLRRWAHPKPAPQVLESAARMERMEQAVDAIAIEIERVSEGQRFMTQLMTTREPVLALGVGQAPAEPIRVGEAQSVARSSA